MFGMYLARVANNSYQKLVDQSWSRAPARLVDAGPSRFQFREEVAQFVALLLIAALVEAKGSVSAAARVLRFKHHQSLIALLDSEPYRWLQPLRHQKRHRTGKKKKSRKGKKARPRIKLSNKDQPVSYQPEWLPEVEPMARELLEWFRSYPLTFRQVVNGFEHRLIELALAHPDCQQTFKNPVKSPPRTSVSRAAKLLGFGHHQALISLIKERHKDLLQVRATPIKRFSHQVNHSKVRKRTRYRLTSESKDGTN